MHHDPTKLLSREIGDQQISISAMTSKPSLNIGPWGAGHAIRQASYHEQPPFTEGITLKVTKMVWMLYKKDGDRFIINPWILQDDKRKCICHILFIFIASLLVKTNKMTIFIWVVQ